jgi:pimeloyl-ACP methyl ester carboxylesterase
MERIVSLRRGLRVRVIDEGRGPVALLLHGNPDNVDEYRALIELLRTDYRCVAPDLPGYGRRYETIPLPASFDYSREAQIGFVDDLLDELQITEKVFLIVHDIGGIMGVPWAARNTSRLRGVIYTNTVAYPRYRWFPLAYAWGADSPLGRRLAALRMTAIGLFGGRLFRKIYTGQHPRLSAAEIERFTVDFALNDVAKATTLRQFRQLTRADFFDGYDEMLRAIAQAVPTATVWGDGDPYVETRFAEQLFARKTTILPGVGHWVPILAAAAIADQLRALESL